MEFHSHPLLCYVQDRLHNKNKNFIAVICGEAGSGKSLAAVRIAESIDPDFTIKNVVFTAKEFMERLVGGKKSREIKRGSVIVFDEAGVGVPAREWQSTSNKLIGYISQTFRSDNICLILTVPAFSFIDVQLRKLLHCYIETMKIDHVKKVCVLKPQMLQYNSKYDELYYKYFKIPGGRISRLSVHLPSDDILNAYEARKQTYNLELQERILAELSQDDTKTSKKEKPDEEKIIDEIFQNKKRYLINKKGVLKVNRGLIEIDFKIGGRISARIAEKITSMKNEKNRE